MFEDDARRICSVRLHVAFFLQIIAGNNITLSKDTFTGFQLKRLVESPVFLLSTRQSPSHRASPYHQRA